MLLVDAAEKGDFAIEQLATRSHMATERVFTLTLSLGKGDVEAEGYSW